MDIRNKVISIPAAACDELANEYFMVSALIPWNIALLAPMTILGAGADCIPFLAYIYLVPLCNFIYLKVKRQSPE